MIYIYRLLYFILRSVLFLASPVLPASLKSWIQLRNKPLDKNQILKNTYWFHASSGEIEYCKSVIRNLKAQQPDAKVVVTYSSPSAEKLFFNISQYVDQFIPLPWDQPCAIKKLIKYINPQVLIFSRTDLWPELIRQAKKAGCKIGVISYNPKFSAVNNAINRYLLDQFDFISCLNEKASNRIRLLTQTEVIKADGDTRFDQVFHRLQQESKVKIVSTARILVCGSTWPEDEAVLFESFSFLIKKNIKIVLCPHDVSSENIQRLQTNLRQKGWTFSLLSSRQNLQNIALVEDVFIVDKVGYLADLYRYAELAFVGGSFKEKVHSVMEPLCCGLPTIVGPHFQNNPEAVRYLNSSVFKITNADNLMDIIELSPQINRKKILDDMEKNKEASLRALQTIQSTLPKT